MEEHDVQAPVEGPARFQFRLRTLLIVVFLVSLFFSAVATLGNVVLGCGLGVPIGLVVGVMVGRARRSPWCGMSGGIAGALFVNGSLALLIAAVSLLFDDAKAANPPTMFLLRLFFASSTVGALPGAIVGVRARQGIETSVSTGTLAFSGMATVVAATYVTVGMLFGLQIRETCVFDSILPILVALGIGPPIGAGFGALYWLFDERVRKHLGLIEQRSDGVQSRTDLSAGGHGPDGLSMAE